MSRLWLALVIAACCGAVGVSAQDGSANAVTDADADADANAVTDADADADADAVTGAGAGADAGADADADADADAGAGADADADAVTDTVERADYVQRPRWYRPYPSWFLAGRVDFGLVIARPRLSLGWGHAHERWLGIEGNPTVTFGGVGAYGGIRFFLPFIDIRSGARFVRSFQRSFLDPMDEYDSLDFQIRQDGKAKYTTVETELTFDFPAGPGNIVGEAAYSAVLGIPDDRFVFEERIHIVLDPPHVWRVRAGYGIRFKMRSQVRIIPVVELVGNPARDLVVWRGGVLVNMRLWDTLEIKLIFLPPLKTRDDFGIEAGVFGLGVRYRWAWIFDKRRRKAQTKP